MTERYRWPAVTVDPAVGWGRPTVDGRPVHSVACAVWHAEDAERDYDLSREQVIVACWYAGRHGVGHGWRVNRRWRRRFREYSRAVDGLLWNGAQPDEVPDPPDGTG